MGVEFSAVETNHTIATGLLGDVKSIVRRSHQCFLVLHLRMGRRCDAAAHRPFQLPALVLKSMGIHLLAQSLGERYRRVQDRSRQDEQEFLPSVASNAVYLPGLVLQELRELIEHRVPSLMPVVVVHALELVDVAHDDRYRLVQPHGMAPHLLQPILERAPVLDSRQPIG
jgi:hypothetical protein